MTQVETCNSQGPKIRQNLLSAHTLPAPPTHTHQHKRTQTHPKHMRAQKRAYLACIIIINSSFTNTQKSTHTHTNAYIVDSCAVTKGKCCDTCTCPQSDLKTCSVWSNLYHHMCDGDTGSLSVCKACSGNLSHHAHSTQLAARRKYAHTTQQYQIIEQTNACMST